MDIVLKGMAETLCDGCGKVTICTYWGKHTWIFTFAHCDKCLPNKLRQTMQTKVTVKEQEG